MRAMMDRKKLERILINVMFALALIMVAFPLLLIAKYAFPSADDWAFGALGYHALKNGEGLFGVIRAAAATVKDYRAKWEGRYSIVFLGALQPGIWGERYYGIVGWLMIGSVIVSEIYLCGSLLKKYAKEKGRWLCLPIIVPSLILQLLYNPAPQESFYWYNGSVSYTFAYGLSLILLGLFIKLGSEEYKTGGYLWRAAAACILAVLVGGDNYSTSLSCLLTLLLLSALFLLLDRRAFFRTWFVTVIVGISLLICILAPGNMVRLYGSYGGVIGKKRAIMMSLEYSLRLIYAQSADVKTALMLLLILPFLWKAVKSMDYSFRFPLLFTIVTFCLHASQATPNMYVEKGMHSGRAMGILFFSCHVWIVGNVGYWVGWISRQHRVSEIIDRICGKAGKYLLVYSVLMGILFTGRICRSGGSSFVAYQSWQRGEPQQYAKEWEARLEVLHDDSVKEVYFPWISIYPPMIMYTDLETADGIPAVVWVNSACARYYDKDVVCIEAPEE